MLLTALLFTLALGQLQAGQPRILPSYFKTADNQVHAVGTSFVSGQVTDPDNNPADVTSVVTFSYADNGDAVYGSNSTVGAGIVIHAVTTTPVYDGVSNSRTDEGYSFIPLGNFLQSGFTSVFVGGGAGMYVSASNSDGTGYSPAAIKTYAQPTVFADTLLIFSSSGEQLIFSGGALYADGTVMETYTPSNADAIDARTLHILRFQGPTPSNKASLVAQDGDYYNGSGNGGYSAPINTDDWYTDTGTFTIGSHTFYKNYPF
jgi:hypothetical protein